VWTEVIVVIGPGSIGQAIARRVSAGKQVVLADLRQENADAAAEVLSNAGFEVSTAIVDVSARGSVHALVQTATGLGDVTGVIHAAGVSPSQASPETILSVDLYGTALVLEEFGKVIAAGGAGVVIASQSGHHLGPLTAEQDVALAMTPTDELLALPMLQPDQVTDPLHAYQLSKRGNALRVMAEAVRWGKRGARVNTISHGIVITPLAKDELTGPRGEGYRRMIELCPAGRAGTPDEVGTVGALLMGPEGASPAATSLWTAGSPPPTRLASSRRNLLRLLQPQREPSNPAPRARRSCHREYGPFHLCRRTRAKTRSTRRSGRSPGSRRPGTSKSGGGSCANIPATRWTAGRCRPIDFLQSDSSRHANLGAPQSKGEPRGQGGHVQLGVGGRLCSGRE
jgi:NAD(P)-dependent dehydrogenase (short-subunit alcohol dehydrogenase family)